MDLKGVLALLVLSAMAVSGALDFENPQPKGESWEQCGLAIDDILAEGNGTTPGSCMSCVPTTDSCEAKCQPLIDIFFEACDGTYTPPGYFYDPARTISGGWYEKAEEIRIAVFRCGCNAAAKKTTVANGLVLLFSLLLLLPLR